MADGAWERVKTILADALEREENQRAAFVADACGDDEALRGQVMELLAYNVGIDDVFETPTALAPAQAPAVEGATIGRYSVRRTIATGGMGTVYEAVQDHPRRAVALKVLRQGVASRSALRRFKHEAEILGRLRHPNIAQIHDAGTFDRGDGAQPYFAMELIKGQPLVEYADANSAGTRQRLGLFVKVCDAVQHAHHKGVIHRDLKPDNILVDDFGVPKILDFGVARATDSDIQTTTLRTDIGELIGTVPYMSPEEVGGDPEELDMRSDVYSLGVVLYELLAGRLPHDLRNKKIPEAVRVIGEEDPVPLSSVNRSFRGDLDTIVAKALEKEKDRRYQSAGDLGADVRHYLADEPIVARPASTFYQLRKFARRNKTLVGGVAGMFLLLVAGTTVSTIGFVRAKYQARKAGLVGEFLVEMLESANAYSGQRDLTVVELLGDVTPWIDERFAPYPDIAVKMRGTIGYTYHTLGWEIEAEEQLRVAWAQSAGVFGDDDPRTRAALGLLVDTLPGTPEGILLARKLLNDCQRACGDAHQETLRAIFYLSWKLHESGSEENLREAQVRLSEAVELSAQTHGETAEVTLGLIHMLTNNLMRQYKLAEAEGWARRSVEAGRHLAGKDRHIHMGRATTELAYVLGLQGKADQGAKFALQGAELNMENLGPGWGNTRVSLFTAGMNLQWAGHLEEAEGYLLKYQSENLQMAAHREDPTSQFADFLLARIRLLRGEQSPQEALPVIDAFVAAKEKTYYSTFYGLGLTAKMLCLVRMGRYAEAEALMAELPDKLMTVLPRDHYERRLYRATLVELYEGLSEHEKAAEYRDSP